MFYGDSKVCQECVFLATCTMKDVCFAVKLHAFDGSVCNAVPKQVYINGLACRM